MNQLELLQELAEAAGTSVRLNLEWPNAAAIVNGDEAEAAPYRAVITDALRVLGADEVDDADETAISLIARWKLWEKVSAETALDYDESQGDRSTSLSNMHKQARIEANRAYFDALPYIPSYRVRRATIVRKPDRFPRSARFASARKDGLRNA